MAIFSICALFVSFGILRFVVFRLNFGKFGVFGRFAFCLSFSFCSVRSVCVQYVFVSVCGWTCIGECVFVLVLSYFRGF